MKEAIVSSKVWASFYKYTNLYLLVPSQWGYPGHLSFSCYHAIVLLSYEKWASSNQAPNCVKHSETVFIC